MGYPRTELARRVDALPVVIRIRNTPLRQFDPIERLPVMEMQAQGEIVAARFYRGGGFTLIVTVDITHHGQLIHASLSHRARIPTWPELLDVRHTVWRESEDVMMVMPKAEDYVNIHQFAMHLWSVPTAWDIR